MDYKDKKAPTVIFKDGNEAQAFAQMMAQAMVMANSQAAGGQMPSVHKDATLGALTSAAIYGRRSVFDPCQTGDIFGLQVETHGLLNWLGFRPNRFYERHVSFITWWGPEGTASGGDSPGTGATAPCDDPPGWEWGSCGYKLCHKSFYSRAGDPLDPHTVVQDRCETTPRYRLNGVMISDDVEWQMNGAMNALKQSVERDTVHGSHANAYEMNGLENLVKTGYIDYDRDGVTCPMVDSILVNWGSDDLDGALNGFGNFFNYLDEVVTEIEWRAQALGSIAEADMILLTSRFMATCLLDAYACYTTCGVTTANDITDQALRAQQRQMRNSLNAGPLYDGRNAVGYIQLKSGRRLPIIVEDTLDINFNGANYTTDIYLLTRRIGSMDVLYGEYLDMRVAQSRYRSADPNVRMRSDAAGRFLIKGKEQNFCHQMILATSPEIYISAPWAQARFYDIGCSRNRRPLVGDPFQPYYMPGGADGLYTSNTPFYSEEGANC